MKFEVAEENDTPLKLKGPLLLLFVIFVTISQTPFFIL
jgi:hypothetical protein